MFGVPFDEIAPFVDRSPEPALVNGVVGAVGIRDGEPFSVGSFTIRG